MTNGYLRIGQIVRPHGVQGAVKLAPLTDDVNRFRGMREAYLEQHGQTTPVLLSVLSIRSDAVVVQMEGCHSPEDAERLRGAYLSVDRAHAVPLSENTYFVTDLIGCRLTDTDGVCYGKITDVLSTGANDVYVVDDGKLMLPALKKLLANVDVEQRVITVHTAVLKEVGLFED